MGVTAWLAFMLTISPLLIGHPELVSELKYHLKKKFNVSDLGMLSHCIGVEIYRDQNNGVAFIKQAAYLHEVLKTYGMDNANPVGTPAEPNLRLTQSMSPQNQTDRDNVNDE